MSKKLWFISEEGDLINVFDKHDTAREELYYLREDDPFSNFKIYGLSDNEIKDHPDEYELAVYEGYIISDKREKVV